MDNKGQSGAIDAIIFALVGAIGLYIFLVLWSPIASQLLPLLDNSQTISLGAPAKLFVMMIPIILVFVLVIGIIMKIKGERQPPQYY